MEKQKKQNGVKILYSRKKVQKAGEVLIDSKASVGEKKQAMEVLSNWRAAHAVPMHSLLITLRQNVFKIDPQALIVQRLKRLPSILEKLKRYESMKLQRIQDIGGCRAILQNVDLVESLLERLQKSKTRNKLIKINDYLNTPKDTGYRGVHLVYKYNGRKKDYHNLLIEIQLRSKIQHSWATAVELVGNFTNEALKSSEGDPDWLSFFKYVSAAFSHLESRPVTKGINGKNVKKEIQRLQKKLSVFTKLQAFVLSTNIIGQNTDKSNDYFLLELDESARHISVTPFSYSNLEVANKMYSSLEQRAQGDPFFNVVLVSASSIQNLKAAYPNYFADSGEFIKNLKNYLG